MRAVHLSLAGFFFVLAVVGVALPLVPTTPFLLLTSYFLVRSSPQLHEKLLRSKVFGPFLRDWQEHRAVKPRVKIVAVSTTLGVVALSVASSRFGPVGLLVLGVLATLGLIVVLRLQTLKTSPTSIDPPA